MGKANIKAFRSAFSKRKRNRKKVKRRKAADLELRDVCKGLALLCRDSDTPQERYLTATQKFLER